MRLGPIKKKLVYHPRPRLNSWPQVYKNTICRASGILSGKHTFLLATLLTTGPVVWQFVVVVTVQAKRRTLFVWETVVFIFDVSLSQIS